MQPVNYDKSKKHRALRIKSFSLSKLNLYQDKIKANNDILKIDKKDIYVLRNEAFDLNQAKKYHEAIGVCNKILELIPHDIKVLLIRAYALYKIEEYQDALISYEIILSIDPKNVIANKSKNFARLRIKEIVDREEKIKEMEEEREVEQEINSLREIENPDGLLFVGPIPGTTYTFPGYDVNGNIIDVPYVSNQNGIIDYDDDRDDFEFLQEMACGPDIDDYEHENMSDSEYAEMEEWDEYRKKQEKENYRMIGIIDSYNPDEIEKLENAARLMSSGLYKKAIELYDELLKNRPKDSYLLSCREIALRKDS